jgi:nickel-dependent lactate racemase
MEITLGFGKRKLNVELPDPRIMDVLLPEDLGKPPDSGEELIRALENPVASPRLRDLLQPGEKIAIITSDITRPCPSDLLLPPLLAELDVAGTDKKDVLIVFALGTHRKHNDEEKIHLVGEDIFRSYACVDSDPDDVTLVGTTTRGTPLEIFRPVVEADKRICLGNIEYHYFAGYSGGCKAIMPGVSTPRSIQANHRMMVEPDSSTGLLDGNSVREDIEEVERFLSVDFILNVVLGPKKEILRAVAGHPVAAHRQGCAFLDSIYKFHLKRFADIVLVSAGGFPKDINMYQAQKALDNARFAVREGGVIILVAACPEEYGSTTIERWITNADSPEQIIRDIQKHFELGGHKAAAIALALRKATVLCVSEMDDRVVKSLFFGPQPDVKSALRRADDLCGPEAKILVMPMGGSTLPVVNTLSSVEL